MANTDTKSKSAKARNGVVLRKKASKSARGKKTTPGTPQNTPRSNSVGCDSASLPKTETIRPVTTSDAGYVVAITPNTRVLIGDNSDTAPDHAGNATPGGKDARPDSGNSVPCPAPDFAGTTVETRRVSPEKHEVAEVAPCPANQQLTTGKFSKLLDQEKFPEFPDRNFSGVEIEIPRDPVDPARTSLVPAPARGTIPTHPFTGDEFRVKLLNEVGVNIDLLRDAVNTTKALLNAEKDGEPDNMARLRAADQVYDLTGVKQSRNSGGNGGKVQVEINIADWARGEE